MAVKLIQKDSRPKIAPPNHDDEVIVMSEAQHDPFLAQATEFRILEAEDGIDAETAFHGQSGKNEAEYRVPLEKAAAVKGKSRFRKRPK